MSQQLDEDSFCLGCYWPDFDMNENNTLSSSNCFDVNCFNNADFRNQHSCDFCDMEGGCCDDDRCSADCPTVCDGFVDCDKLSTCSEPHCAEVDCESPSSACFDKNCVVDGHQYINQDDDTSFLNQDGSLNWDCLGLTSAGAVETPTRDNGFQHGGFESHLHLHSVGGLTSSEFSPAAQTLDLKFFDSHPPPYVKHSRSPINPCLPGHSSGAGAPNVSIPRCNNYLHGCNFQDSFTSISSGCDSDTSFGLVPWAAENRAKPGRRQINCNTGLATYSPTRMNTEFAHTTTTSTHTTPSLSLNSSPAAASDGRELSVSSAFTASDIVTGDELHICNWVLNIERGDVCGASFSDAGNLQEHLALEHADQTRGRQGQGYYCLWEGCHRPDEPFSQKSKLQGHFLTHSNCMYHSNLIFPVLF